MSLVLGEVGESINLLCEAALHVIKASGLWSCLGDCGIVKTLSYCILDVHGFDGIGAFLDVLAPIRRHSMVTEAFVSEITFLLRSGRSYFDGEFVIYKSWFAPIIPVRGFSSFGTQFLFGNRFERKPTNCFGMCCAWLRGFSPKLPRFRLELADLKYWFFFRKEVIPNSIVCFDTPSVKTELFSYFIFMFY